MHEVCLICDEVITNPICPVCLGNEMANWLYEQDNSLDGDFTGVVSNNLRFGHDITSCIICKKEMNICPHCFSKEVYEMLLEKNPMIAEKFRQCFNFELT